MSYSKPLLPFVCDSLYYLNRNQLERFSIVCRPLKNLSTDICIQNRTAFLMNRKAGNWLHDSTIGNEIHYSFDEMRRFLGQSVRIQKTFICLDVGITYNPEHIEAMEFVAHLWCDRKINVLKVDQIVAEDFQIILVSPKILQCQLLYMRSAHFSFKDYKVLYKTKIIENHYNDEETDPDYWPQFIEQPGVKPLVVLRRLYRESINNLLDHLSKAFSSAVSPNAFKFVFAEIR